MKIELKEGTQIRKGDQHFDIVRLDKTHVYYTRHGGPLGTISCMTGRVSFEKMIEGGEAFAMTDEEETVPSSTNETPRGVSHE